jgi:hypothetical protein
MSGVKTITKQAFHHLAGQLLVSIQEAIHMVDNQELVISSNKTTYLRWCPQARFFNHKIIKSYLSRPKKGMIGDLAGVPETIILL